MVRVAGDNSRPTGCDRVLRPRVLQPRRLLDGGLSVCLTGRRFTRRVEELVAEAFIGLVPDGMAVRHRNGDRADNQPSNLAYSLDNYYLSRRRVRRRRA